MSSNQLHHHHQQHLQGNGVTKQKRSANKQDSARKRSNTRPCDGCAVRRVRCDLATSSFGSCTNCINHNMECTNIRVRHKSGPKKIQQKTRENIVKFLSANGGSVTGHLGTPQYSPSTPSMSSTPSFKNHLGIYNNSITREPTCNIPLNNLLPYLQVYQTWYYGLWPVLSVAHLISKLTDNNCQTASDGCIVLNEENASYYALSCAVCAAIGVQIKFLKSTGGVIKVENTLQDDEYAKEARRVRFLFEDKIDSTTESLLTSFFLHMYYGNIEGGTRKGIVYLREAVSLAQILSLHDPESYIGKLPAEVHRCKKIYYMLLVTERYVCLHENLPILLEPTIEIPSLHDEEYPELLSGFTEIVEVFSSTGKQFFQEVGRKLLLRNSSGSSSESSPDSENGFNNMFGTDLSIFQDLLQNQPTEQKRETIGQMQLKLDSKRHKSNKTKNESQKLNIILSKSWLQSLGWLIAKENFIINKNDHSESSCFSFKFPMKIAQEFLEETKDLPDFAFESNGAPGVCNKLLEIADSLYGVTMLATSRTDSTRAFDQMSTVYGIFMKHKTPDIHIIPALYHKIGTMIESKRLTYRQPDPIEISLPGDEVIEQSVQQIDEGYHSITGFDASDEIPDRNMLSPFSQFSMYYSIPTGNITDQSFGQITELP
ncbi:Maltose fermentation regulatory protein MAL63 [Wickerhamomyces ciferrii]|uniref:Maltose fermentation regulatory protein MAL63 n=1 Tax=Wickerhamomyces ciferrii (strain ATCC 14091 / BCRC 22168 / CBS 111 / JCM 3599 / NBRC 0793 / NRRL Y-1031 F-60-10) TaxID=1206466 RepID=K0K998_WICCF|nr:Maltose fermentation regulatory protein MAL63 [Wickerhamomyces ciferrii]CCH41480.1 Maltose fermentation regulatory protein MAL63 [Wickerhamomyces ciferrii]